jgi:hypothetical protein
MEKEKTPSKRSPKGGKKGCICPDGTYNSKCCDGSLQAQGIGSSGNAADETVTETDTNGTRHRTRVSG